MSSNNLTINLYGGKYTGAFTAGNHRYKINNAYKKGVTTILGASLAKPGLALWPLNEALKSLGAIWDEQTHQWYSSMPGGLIITDDDINKAAKAHTVRRDKGADTGSEAHSAVETFLKGNDINQLLSPEASKAYEGFKAWYNGLVDRSPIGVERVVYSEKYDYCGTYDSLLRINGKVYLCDLKTSNPSRTAPEGVYPEAFIQLGAYLQAYNEEREYLKDVMSAEQLEANYPLVDDVMVISCKKDGRVHTKTGFEVGLSMSSATNLWLGVHTVYNGMETLKAQLGGK